VSRVAPSAIRVVDSHTEGEPTRVVIDGWPQPTGDTMAARRDDLRARFDHLREAVVCEPRGHSAIVGALLTPPVSPDAAAGVIFFNNGTYLGMCGHGLIGVVRTLEHLGRLAPGECVIDTPVGQVRAELSRDGSVTIENVPARVHATDVRVDVPGHGVVTGDIAWGGNWFFITHADDVPVAMGHLAELMTFTQEIQVRTARPSITSRSLPLRRAPTPTAATSCSALAASMIARRAARVRRRPWRRDMRTDSSRWARCGVRKALPVGCSRGG
jgi:4-hydroxyproline epimerase